MAIQATCPQCGATLPVPEEFAGQTVRCGGCRSVVKVPVLAQPLAPLPGKTADVQPLPAPSLPKARPVAVPLARKISKDAKPEPPRIARKFRAIEDDTALEVDTDEESTRPKARPVAQRQRDTILTPKAAQWMFCFLMTGMIGLFILAYAAWGLRRNDRTALPPIPETRR